MTSYEKQMISRELRRVGAYVRKGDYASMESSLEGLATIREKIESEAAKLADGKESGNNGNSKKVVLKRTAAGKKSDPVEE